MGRCGEMRGDAGRCGDMRGEIEGGGGEARCSIYLLTFTYYHGLYHQQRDCDLEQCLLWPYLLLRLYRLQRDCDLEQCLLWPYLLLRLYRLQRDCDLERGELTHAQRARA